MGEPPPAARHFVSEVRIRFICWSKKKRSLQKKLSAFTISSMEKIPQEVLQSIFQFVPSKGDWFNIMVTCKRFLSVGRVIFNPSVDDNEAIQWASENGKLEAARCLLKDQRVDPSADNNKAFRDASRLGHLEIVKELLKDSRVDPTVWNFDAIKNAATSEHWEIVRLLLCDSRVDPSAKQHSLLFLRKWTLRRFRSTIIKRIAQRQQSGSFCK